MSNTILTLASAADKQRVGGKAYALAQLLDAGFTVPAGFVIATDAKWNAELDAVITANFAQLNCNLVAVRSSAINEDGIETSWAGQLETYLNVDEAHLLAAIKACQRSADSVRASSYAKQHNLAKTEIAVIVQEMVQSDVSGVAFSVNPVTESADQLVIEAALGLGEAVVSGEINPDSYVIEKETGLILEQQIVEQSKRLIVGSGSENVWQSLIPPRIEAKLSNKQLVELVAAVRRVEALFGFPVDIEWAYVDTSLYMLQSRPITTIKLLS
jgi:phosphoenolpyruvate synthase/pyruvate phosphate dikinase